MLKIKGVIFDMDGTLSVPYIDWKSLRAEIDCSPEKTIIEHIDGLPPDRASRANHILLAAEREACENAALNDGVRDLLDHLRQKGIRLALVTNNHGAAMRIFLKLHDLHFQIALSRDDGTLKPASDLIEKALETLDLTADEVIGIGDGRYDIESCRRAGVKCIYLTHGSPALDHTPAVKTLYDIPALLSEWDTGEPSSCVE